MAVVRQAQQTSNPDPYNQDKSPQAGGKVGGQKLSGGTTTPGDGSPQTGPKPMFREAAGQRTSDGSGVATAPATMGPPPAPVTGGGGTPAPATGGAGGGGGPSIATPGDPWAAPEDGIWGDATRGIAGFNDALNYAFGLVPEAAGPGGAQDLAVKALYSNTGSPLIGKAASGFNYLQGGGQGWNDQAFGRELFDTRKLASRRVSGEEIANDPAVEQAKVTFAQAMRPLIENQAALAGLGNSTAMTNASAAQQAQFMLPMVQEAISREERRGERMLGSAFQRAGMRQQQGAEIARRRLAGAQGNAQLGQFNRQDRLAMVDRLMGMEGQRQQRLGDAFQRAFALGDYSRGVKQDELDAARQDWLRKAAMSENAIGGPLGLIPSIFGGSATSSKKA